MFFSDCEFCLKNSDLQLLGDYIYYINYISYSWMQFKKGLSEFWIHLYKSDVFDALKI